MINLLQKHIFFNDKNIVSIKLLKNQGYCNKNYIVTVNNNKYIVRKLLRNDIDRELEWRVLGLVYLQDITAKPLFYDKVHSFMIFEFLEGRHKRVLNMDDITLLAYSLKKLHSIIIDNKPIRIEIENQNSELIEALKVIEKYPNEYRLCHNDLNPENIIFNKGVKVIDFEYAGVNDRYFDLASVCIEFKLDIEMQKVFLDAYFKSTNYSMEKLRVYKVIYRELCNEWFQKLIGGVSILHL